MSVTSVLLLASVFGVELGEGKKCSCKVWMLSCNQPKGSSWVEKALRLLVFMVGLGAGSQIRAGVFFADVAGSSVCCSKDSTPKGRPKSCNFEKAKCFL